MAYGCYNREPFALERRLYNLSAITGRTELTIIPNVMAKDCQYQKDDKYADPGCVGCKHKKVKPA